MGVVLFRLISVYDMFIQHWVEDTINELLHEANSRAFSVV